MAAFNDDPRNYAARPQDYAMIGAAANKQSEVCDSQPHLNRFMERIDSLTGDIDMIVQQLEDHANRLHGHEGESPCSTDGRDRPAGAVVRMDETINRLQDSIGRLRREAYRNTNLA